MATHFFLCSMQMDEGGYCFYYSAGVNIHGGLYIGFTLASLTGARVAVSDVDNESLHLPTSFYIPLNLSRICLWTIVRTRREPGFAHVERPRQQPKFRRFPRCLTTDERSVTPSDLCGTP